MTEKSTGIEWIESRRKRHMDLAFAAAAMPAAIPVVVAAGLLRYCESGYNPIFRQARIGRDDTSFTIYKIRTLNSSGDFNDPSHGPDDHRATKLGGLLRRTTIDEWPQIINVTNGSMSVVGPRPLIAADVAATHSILTKRQSLEWADARRILRPGWYSRFGLLSRQLIPQSDEYLRERARLDAEYVRTASFDEDIRIIASHYNRGAQYDDAECSSNL